MAKKTKKTTTKKKKRTPAQIAATAKMLRAAKAKRKNKGTATKKRSKPAAKKRPAKKRVAKNKGIKRRRNTAEFPRVTESSEWIPCSGVKFKKQANGEVQVLLKQG